jgi:hypothetical protein
MDLQRRRGTRPQRRRKTVRRCNGLLAWSWCYYFGWTHRVEKRREKRDDRLDGYLRMLLEVAAAQFARGDRRAVTYMVLERCVRARSRANRKKGVIEQQQTKHEANRTPREADVTTSRLLGDIAHSLHFIIDAAGADFDASVRLLLNKHSRNERVAERRRKQSGRLPAEIVLSRLRITV